MPASRRLRVAAQDQRCAQRFEGSYAGSWIESWRQESPGAARKGKSMYIGIGTIVLIIIIVLVVLMLRRR
jgi:hypothetical protein